LRKVTQVAALQSRLSQQAGGFLCGEKPLPVLAACRVVSGYQNIARKFFAENGFEHVVLLSADGALRWHSLGGGWPRNLVGHAPFSILSTDQLADTSVHHILARTHTHTQPRVFRT
jgi:hypothetical protein